MMLILNQLLIALAANSKLKDLLLTLELLIFGLEHPKLFIKSLCQVFHHHGSFSNPSLHQSSIDTFIRSLSIRATYSFQTNFVLGAELLRLLNSQLAEGTEPVSNFRWGLRSLLRLLLNGLRHSKVLIINYQ